MLNPKEISDLSSSAQAKRTIGGKVEVGPKYPCLWVVMIETLIIWMLVGLGVLVWYFSDQLPFNKLAKTDSEPAAAMVYTQDQLLADTGIDLKGWLMLSIVPKGSKNLGLETYVYDFTDAQELLYPDLNQVPDRVAAFSLFHTVSSNNAWVTYAGTLGVSDAVAPNNIMQIFRAPLSSTGSISPDIFTESHRQAEQVSGQPGRKSIPQVNSVGDVIYTVLSGTVDTESDFPPAEAYLINHISSIDGEERLLIEGSRPRWVSDTTFVFLRNNGLYSYDITNRKLRQVLPQQTFGGEVQTNIGLAVSDNGSLLAISNPNLGKLSVYRVADWEDPVPVFVNMAKVSGFWPTFSPGGSILALQTANVRPQIEFYNVDVADINHAGISEKALKALPFTINLDSYEQQQMFITDWIK